MSFWSDLTGASARSDAKKAYKDSSGMLQQGYDTARGDITSGSDKALGYLDPYLGGGVQANKLLLDYLGVNGGDAQRAAYENFNNDPGWEAEQQAGINALDRSATARGGLYSGAALKGVSEYGQRFQREAFNNRLNALAGVAGQGQQTAGAAAGLASNTGSQLGDLAFGFGQQNAANRINLGNAQAQSRGVLTNNLLNIAGTAVRAMNPLSGLGGR